jgi:hypothetical protein
VIAATVALALALAPGAARQRPPAEPSQTNAARARRGLLPRKLVRRPPSRARRVVLLPASPTWLGEPTGVADPVVVLADAEGAAPEGAARARLAPMAAADAPDEVAASTGPWASAAGTEVSVLLVVRPSGGRGPGPLQAGVAGAEVQAVIRRAAPAR